MGTPRDRGRKMRVVLQAIEDYRAGRLPTTPCPECGGQISVRIDERLGSTWVTCPKGCTTAHFKFEPQRRGEE